MGQMTRSSVLWVVLGIIVLLLVFNQWMSKEISHPTQQRSADQPSTNDPAKAQQSFTLPQFPQEEDISQVPDNTQQPENSSPKIGEIVNEPIYEPPSNDVILVE